jgi:hypothetical protein
MKLALAQMVLGVLAVIFLLFYLYWLLITASAQTPLVESNGITVHVLTERNHYKLFLTSVFFLPSHWVGSTGKWDSSVC